MSASLDIDPEIAEVARDFKWHGQTKYFVLKIENYNSLVIDKEIPPKTPCVTKTVQEDENEFNDMKKRLPANEPRYIIYNFFPVENKDGYSLGKFAFILWSPKNCSVRLKMLYASSKIFVGRSVENIGPWAFNAIEENLNDMDYRKFYAEIQAKMNG